MTLAWNRRLRAGSILVGVLAVVLALVLGSGNAAAESMLPSELPSGVCPTGGTTPLPVPITLTVTLQRPNSPPPDPSWAVPVTLTLYPPGDPDTVCYQWNLTLDQNGQWSGSPSMFTGAYDVRAKNVHTLRNVKRNVVIDGPVTIDMGTLLEGDANGDNTVNILDFARLRSSYFLDEGMPGFDPTADFDENDTINILDFGLLRSNYFTDGDIEVPSLALAAGAGLAATAPVTLTLVPLQRDLAVDAVTEFRIQVDALAQSLLGLDVELFYRPSIVSVVDASGAPVTGLTLGTAFPTVLQNRVDEAHGKITLGVANFDHAVGGVIDIAQFYLKGISPGPAGMWFGPRSIGMDDSYTEVVLVLATPAISVGGVSDYRLYLPLTLQT